MYINFTLSRAYDDLGDCEKSFCRMSNGNQVRNAELGYKIDDDKKLFDNIRKVFRKGILTAEKNSLKGYSRRPIFIVGMPRSDTSLVEQILATHTMVHGACELHEMNNLVKPMLSRLFQQSNGGQPKVDMANLHNNYSDMLDKLGTSERFVTDKMPLNFRWISFIWSALPDAKIIHLKRDATATCWSIYKNNFSSDGNGFGYDLVDVAEYYNLVEHTRRP